MSSQPQHVRVAILGAKGRMGQRLCALASTDQRFLLAAALLREGDSSITHRALSDGSSPITFESAAACQTPFDVLIDFSMENGTLSAIDLAVNRRAALLVGVTGLTASTLTKIHDASAQIPVLIAPNTSLGVAAVADVAARLTKKLGSQYRCGIFETHHIHKKDSPSGTAKRLAKSVRDGGGNLPDDQIVALRGGDVIGEHTVRFAGPGEYIEITHRATSRDLFARGALTAAAWLCGKSPGRYTIEDVIANGAD